MEIKVDADCEQRAASSPNVAALSQFYMREECLEVSARHLLFLAIMLDDVLPTQGEASAPVSLLKRWNVVQPKWKCFSSCTGTAPFASARKRILLTKSSKFCGELHHASGSHEAISSTSLFTHEDGPLAAFVDLSHLKHKERDELEKIIKSWRDGTFDMAQLRCAHSSARKVWLTWRLQLQLRAVIIECAGTMRFAMMRAPILSTGTTTCDSNSWCDLCCFAVLKFS